MARTRQHMVQADQPTSQISLIFGTYLITLHVLALYAIVTLASGQAPVNEVLGVIWSLTTATVNEIVDYVR